MMKKCWFYILLLSTLLSCGSGNEEKNDGKANSVSAYDQMINEALKKDTTGDIHSGGAKAPILLSEDDFAAKVFDYRTDRRWHYSGDKPCIIDFYADWCKPCRMIAPYLEEFAGEYSGKLYIYKVNVDDAGELSAYFQINSIPAVMFCPLKGDYKIVMGANPKETYLHLIHNFLHVN
jgi:thioredoxin